ncbi:MAG: MFS transporter [Paucibacter sp.]|nr:MFS transporter [Roseateles sp.]
MKSTSAALIARGFPWLIASLVATHAGMAVTRVTASLWLLSHGHGEWLVGVLISCSAAGPVLLSLWAGRQADRFGLHRPLLIGTVLSLAGALSALLWPAPATMAIASFLCGSAVGILAVAIQREAGLIGEEVGDLKRVFSWVALGPALSNVLSPVLAGLLIDHAGHAMAFGLAVALPLLAWGLGQRVPRHAPRGAEQASRDRPAWLLLRDRGLRNLLMINVVLTACWDAHTFVVPVVGHAQGLSASSIGLVLGSFATAATVVRLLIVRWGRGLDELTVLRTAMVMVALTLIVYAWLPGTPGLMFGSAVLGLALGSYQPMILSALHQVTPADRQGQALGLRMLVSSGMSMAMPLSFGAIAASTAAFGPLWLMALLAVGAQVPAQSLKPILDRLSARSAT